MAALSPSADDARMLVDLAALLTETVATVNALELPPVPVVAAYALPLLSRTPRADRFFDFPREDRHKIWSSVIEANLNLRRISFSDASASRSRCSLARWSKSMDHQSSAHEG